MKLIMENEIIERVICGKWSKTIAAFSSGKVNFNETEIMNFIEVYLLKSPSEIYTD